MPAFNSRINLYVTLSSLMEKVERIQYHAALAITGTWQGSNRAKHYKELGCGTLSDRRWCMRILHINKIKNNMTPSSLRDKLPPIRRPLYRFGYTNREIRCKTSRNKNSFFPDAINSWNNIITNAQNFPPFTNLQLHILSLNRPKIKSTFGVHDPLGRRYLFQLRVRPRNHKTTKDTIILQTPLREFGSATKVLKILAIFYLNVPVTRLIERI